MKLSTYVLSICFAACIMNAQAKSTAEKARTVHCSAEHRTYHPSPAHCRCALPLIYAMTASPSPDKCSTSTETSVSVLLAF
jgi:hypothetical protein